MSEAEAMGVRMCIDHYEPRESRPELINEYSNLMYSCDECNLRKSDRVPSNAARAAGVRFFRPDLDAHDEHFTKGGIRLESKTQVGYYTLEALDLNRLALRKLRHIRDRLTKCHRLVNEGVLGLRKFHIDRLPRHIKASAARAISKLDSVADAIGDDIDTLLRKYARSPLLDEDPEAQARAEERMAKLKQLEILYAGAWRAREQKRERA